RRDGQLGAHGVVCAGRRVCYRVPGTPSGRRPTRRSRLASPARDLDPSKQPVVLVVRSRSEVELVGIARRATPAEQDLPQPIDGDSVPGGILDEPAKVAAAIEGRDVTAPEVPDEQHPTESPEALRGERHSPRGAL